MAEIDFSHLDAIDQRLVSEQARVRQAKTAKEREWREHNVSMIERERLSELKFLGIDSDPREAGAEMSIEEILAEMESSGLA